MTFRSRTLYQLSYNGLPTIHEKIGGRGRIRTSVARKERQVYSLLVLTTHPPVQTTARNAPTQSEILNTGKLRSYKAGGARCNWSSAESAQDRQEKPRSRVHAATSTCSICVVGSGMASPCSRMPSMWNSIASRISSRVSSIVAPAAIRPGRSGTCAL